DNADARSRHRRSHGTHSSHRGYSPPYADIVVDANSGQVLHAANADSLRHPASLTKIMTLYLLFEQLEAGRLKLDSRLPVSAHAASQAPTKLELKPGQTIAVEDAIRGIVTKSANDAAVVVAEAIGGSENDFALLMTRKARALGMTRTVYANASGLPDSEQLTTARDQVVLGRAIQDRFPRYYSYFAASCRRRAARRHRLARDQSGAPRRLGRTDPALRGEDHSGQAGPDPGGLAGTARRAGAEFERCAAAACGCGAAADRAAPAKSTAA